MTSPHVSLDAPWLTCDLGARKQVLSWALNRPGFVEARRIIWREVRNADLPKTLDVESWLDHELALRDETESVAFLTSRNIALFHVAEAHIGEIRATAIATVGLSNAERVGHKQKPHPLSYGTINIAVDLNIGLREAALIEALSIAVQARTAAVLEAQLGIAFGNATGTGTDCMAIAAPFGETLYAGLHTDLGEAIGRAVYDATAAGVREWMTEQEETPHA